MKWISQMTRNNNYLLEQHHHQHTTTKTMSVSSLELLIKQDLTRLGVYYTDISLRKDSYGKEQIWIYVNDYFEGMHSDQVDLNYDHFVNEGKMFQYIKQYGIWDVSSSYSDTIYRTGHRALNPRIYKVTLMTQEEIRRKVQILQKVLKQGYNPEYKGRRKPMSDVRADIEYYKEYLPPQLILTPKYAGKVFAQGGTITFGDFDPISI